MRWIIDGNNLMHRVEGLRGLLARDAAGARRRLLEMLATFSGGPDVEEIVVVFDGRGERIAGEPAAPPGITTLYSPANLTADTVIERLVVESAEPAGCLVVSSDRPERETVLAAGAETMACGDFLRWIDERRRRLDETLKRRRRTEPPFTLGDLFP